KVEALEQDKVDQALEIIKLKQRVKKLERKNKLKVSGLRRLRKREIIANIDADEDVTLKDVAVVERTAEIEENTDDDELEPAELKEVVEVVTAAKLMTEVVTVAAATITVATTPIIAATITVAPNKGKEIMVEEPKPLKKQAQIEQDEAYARELEAKLNKNINWDDVIKQVQRKEKEDNAVLRFKMEYFKGIFEKYFNLNVAFLEKTNEQLEEKESRALKRKTESSEEKAAKKQKLDEEVKELKKHLQIVPNNDDDVYTKAIPLALKVSVMDYEIYSENNKPYFKIIRADRTHQLFLSFLSLLRNFDREDFEVLWQLVKERFASSKPKNLSDDFLLTTLTYMFEKPDVEAQVWKSERGVYGLEKVKSWRLLESCGVHIITLTTTQMILLVEIRYPLTRLQGKYAKGLRLLVEDLMLPIQIDAAG
nr:hypothetical protein [Tanacetum cinerariifolium]